MKSLLDVVAACDTLPYPPAAFPLPLCEFRVDGDLVGHILPDVVAHLVRVRQQLQLASLLVTPSLVTFHPTITTIEARTACIAEIVDQWRAEDCLSGLRGWRDESYPVYARHGLAFTVERAAAALFGVATFGVHLNIHVGPIAAAHPLRMWVARRSATKQTYAGMLDNAVAGGIPQGSSVLDALIKECAEEAGIAADVACGAVPRGTVSYALVTADGIQPEVQFVFDLEVADDTVLVPTDGEVGEFLVMGKDELLARMLAGEFKPNCGLVIVDFLVRHGLVCPDDDHMPAYLEMVRRMHRHLGLYGSNGQQI